MAVSYQCKSCGAALAFNSEVQGFKCSFCDRVYTEQEVHNEYDDIDAILDTVDVADTNIEEFDEHTAEYTCPNCGAGIICSELDASVPCHFCHTPVVLVGRVSGKYRPDLVIPFKIGKEEATESIKRYIRGKVFLPRKFKENIEVQGVTALYVPYWLKSGAWDVQLTAKGTRSTSWRRGNTHYTKTRYYESYRHADVVFMRVPYDGSKRIDDALMQSIEPFDYKDIKPFSMSYIVGTATEKYDVSDMLANDKINTRLLKGIIEIVQRDIKKYDKLDSISMPSEESVRQGMTEEHSTLTYALLPVWFINYRYKGKDYSYVINGQTGKGFGLLPISAAKIMGVLASVGLGIPLIISLMGALYNVIF